MNRRIKKKEWKKMTDKRTEDLVDRVDELEELTRSMVAEQTAQRERVEDVHDELHLFQEAHAKRHRIEDDRRRRQARVRMEREQERRRKRQEWAKLGALAAFAVAFACFALTFPAPELAEEPVQTEVVAVEPAEGVTQAVALSLEG